MAPLGFPIYTHDKTSPRGFRWIWFIRLLQIWITLAVLGITAANASSFNSISCSVPGKLAWNLACAVLALLALAYFFLSTGPTTIFKILPWWIFIQLGLDALMFVFWLSAAASSHYNCNDLCNACSKLPGVEFDNLSCICDAAYYYDYYYEKRGMSPVKKGLLESRRTRHYSRPAGTAAARQGLDAIMVVLFAATLASTVAWIFQNRHRSTTTTTAPATNPAANAEAGVQQVPIEMKQDTPYNPNPNQGGYAPASPVQQQQPYSPQGQYSPQQPQGGYPPQQQYPPQEQYSQPQPQQPPQAYYGGSEGQQIPNYPTPTPEMQAERRDA